MACETLHIAAHCHIISREEHLFLNIKGHIVSRKHKLIYMEIHCSYFTFLIKNLNHMPAVPLHIVKCKLSSYGTEIIGDKSI